jgi:hypothetical protein
MMMPDVFADLLDLKELEKFPSRIKKFIHRDGREPNYEKTWEYFCGVYHEAFDVLARKALEDWPKRSGLSTPLFYLARHSIELSLKDTILEYASTDAVPAKIDGHGLMQLWNQLLGYLERWGVPGTDEWGVYCTKLLNHIHEADPDGERFRYPTAKDGKPFELTRVELDGLIRAQWHLTIYCDGCANMHADGYKG